MKYCIYIWHRSSSQVTFKEVANMMCEAIRSFSNCNLTDKLLNDSDITNIIFGANDSIFEDGENTTKIPSNSIIVNLEQLADGQFWSSPKYLNLLKQYEVWDYSDSNIEYLKSHNITNVKKWNLGWADCLKWNYPSNNEPIDILFYGAMNDRRVKINVKLQQLGVNVVFRNNLFGEERDKLVSQSKVILNIHFYESHILEIVRITPLLINGKCVVSEFGGEDSVNKIWSNGVVMCSYNDIVKTALKLVYNPDLRKKQEKHALQFIKGMQVHLPIAF